MTSLRFGRNLLGLGLVVAMLAGCGGTTIPPQQLPRRFTSWIGSHAQAFIPR